MAEKKSVDTRKQINVRMDDETEVLFNSLLPRAKKVTGLNVSQSDLFRLALQSLQREYDARDTNQKK